MYKSLIPWCKQDIVVRSVGERLPTGETLPGVETVVKGYVVNDAKVITDKEGILYTCTAYVYTLPATLITETDKIAIPGSNKFYEIRKLGGYYDGNTGKLDIQVVYL